MNKLSSLSHNNLRLLPKAIPSFFDFSKNFDFHCYEKAIESGFPLRPMEEAI